MWKDPSRLPATSCSFMEYVEGRSFYAWADEENASARQVVRMLRVERGGVT